MTPSSLPAKILVGISLKADESKKLLSWAIKVLAHPGDTVVALHVIHKRGAIPNKKVRREDNNMKRRKHQREFRMAKSYVISIMGELFKTCQFNGVYLEARVGLYSNAGKGLIEEAKTMGTNYLVLGHKLPNTISGYCSKNVPDGCSLLLVPTHEGVVEEVPNKPNYCIHGLSEWSRESISRLSSAGNSFSSQENETTIEMKLKKPSPISVLESFKVEDFEKCSNSHETKSISNTCMISTLLKGKEELSKKPKSRFKLLLGLFRFSYDLGMRKRNQVDASFGKQKHQPQLRCFCYQEIARATNNFDVDNIVGQGGYSQVYRGDLENGSRIAIKRLAKDNNINAKKEKEFLNELGVIGHVNHPNTAKLVGYCIENGLFLIFNFYPNGTLSSALHGEGSRPLDWSKRYRIIMGIAKGLHYLHKCCKHRIIHRDIKASNVLLAPDYEPQICDFGLAKWLPSKWSHHAVIPIEGTFGYLAPEYFMHGIVDEKIDVYAFGILILEILTGRKPVDLTRQNLLLWARPLMESGNLSELADPKLGGRYEMDELFRVALTASYCVRQSSLRRPSMTEVIELLKYGQESEEGGWRIPKFTSEEMDDYSMIYGYKLPSHLSIEDI